MSVKRCVEDINLHISDIYGECKSTCDQSGTMRSLLMHPQHRCRFNSTVTNNGEANLHISDAPVLAFKEGVSFMVKPEQKWKNLDQLSGM